MLTLAVLAQKGGGGRTTLSVNLAGLIAETRKVLIIDLDPQGSALEWGTRRGDREPDITGGHPASLGKEVKRAAQDGYDFVIIDTPPYADNSAYQAALIADLIMIPCRPATFDVASIKASLRVVEMTKKPHVVVINCAPIRSRVTEESGTAIRAMGGTMCPIVVHQRVAFQHSLIDGRTAAEFEPDGAAANEIAGLLADLQTRMPV